MEGRLESRQTNQTNRTDLRTAMNTIFIKRVSRGNSFNVTMGLSGSKSRNCDSISVELLSKYTK